MRFSGKNRHSPTDEQRKRLARIDNPDQRRALLAAIGRGETIPDYAWTPFARGLEKNPIAAQSYRQLLQYAASSRRDMMEVIASLRPDSHVQYFADKAREAASEATGCLCAAPLCVPDLASEARDVYGILCWGIFNPFGPTLSFLVLIGVPEHPESLLYGTHINPFQCRSVVYGIVPDPILNGGYLNDILDELLSKYSAGEYGLFSDQLPSFIVPLTPQVKFGELVRKGLAHVRNDLVQWECDLLRRIPHDPWRVATEQLHRALSAQKGVERKVLLHEAVANNLDEWLWLVTDKGHLASYIGQMAAAWRGAIEHGPSQLAVMDWESAERILRKLWFDTTGE